MPAAAALNSVPTLKLEREFAAPVARVFAAWTDPRLMAQWWGPENVSCPVCEIDLRVGGRYRTCMKRGNGEENWVSGEYREIVPDRRLAFTWAWEENGKRGHEMLVEVDFARAGANTRVTLAQSNFATLESCTNHRAGWSSSFICLDAFIRKE
jgi:uncharacterized protein YndB with AHSA1/START domain